MAVAEIAQPTQQTLSRYAHMSREQLISALEAHDKTLQSIYNVVHLPNTKMAPGEKLFWVGARCILPDEKPDEDGMVYLPSEKIADFIGMSESSAYRYGRALIDRYDVASKPVPYTTKKGQDRELTYVDRDNPMWSEPWEVDIPEEKERAINGNECPGCRSQGTIRVKKNVIAAQDIAECVLCHYKKVYPVNPVNDPLPVGEYFPQKALQPEEPFLAETCEEEKAFQPEEPFGSEEVEMEKGPQPEEPFLAEDERLENMTPLPIHKGVAVPIPPSVYKNPDLLPELKKKRIWECGRATWNEERGKWDKKPYIADMRGTRGASHSDPSTWRTFECAMAVYEKSQSWNGEAKDDKGPFHFLMVACDDSFTFTDGDHIRNRETGTIDESAEQVVRAINSYTEVSYSGDGTHTLSWGNIPANRKHEPWEMYSKTRFVALTGNVLPEFSQTMDQRSDIVNVLYQELFPPKPEYLWAMAPDDRHRSDEEMEQVLVDLLEKAGRAKNGEKFKRLWNGDMSDYLDPKTRKPDHSRADAGLCKMIAFWVGGSVSTVDWLFRQSRLMRSKWEERADYRERTFRCAFGEEAAA